MTQDEAYQWLNTQPAAWQAEIRAGIDKEKAVHRAYILGWKAAMELFLHNIELVTYTASPAEAVTVAPCRPSWMTRPAMTRKDVDAIIDSAKAPPTTGHKMHDVSIQFTVSPDPADPTYLQATFPDGSTARILDCNLDNNYTYFPADLADVLGLNEPDGPPTAENPSDATNSLGNTIRECDNCGQPCTDEAFEITYKTDYPPDVICNNCKGTMQSPIMTNVRHIRPVSNTKLRL